MIVRPASPGEFKSRSTAVACRLIDGKALADSIRKDVAAEVARLKAEHGKVPGLAVVLVGDDPASQVYVRNKRKTERRGGLRRRGPPPAGRDDAGRAARDDRPAQRRPERPRHPRPASPAAADRRAGDHRAGRPARRTSTASTRSTSACSRSACPGSSRARRWASARCLLARGGRDAGGAGRRARPVADRRQADGAAAAAEGPGGRRDRHRLPHRDPRRRRDRPRGRHPDRRDRPARAGPRRLDQAGGRRHRRRHPPARRRLALRRRPSGRGDARSPPCSRPVPGRGRAR